MPYYCIKAIAHTMVAFSETYHEESRQKLMPGPSPTASLLACFHTSQFHDIPFKFFGCLVFVNITTVNSIPVLSSAFFLVILQIKKGVSATLPSPINSTRPWMSLPLNMNPSILILKFKGSQHYENPSLGTRNTSYHH